MRAEDLLPDDVNEARVGDATVRKGTVGAFLANVRTWSDPATADADRDAAERAIRDAAPTLRAIGLLDVLAPRDPRLATLLCDG